VETARGPDGAARVLSVSEVRGDGGLARLDG